MTLWHELHSLLMNLYIMASLLESILLYRMFAAPWVDITSTSINAPMVLFRVVFTMNGREVIILLFLISSSDGMISMAFDNVPGCTHCSMDKN